MFCGKMVNCWSCEIIEESLFLFYPLNDIQLVPNRMSQYLIGQQNRNKQKSFIGIKWIFRFYNGRLYSVPFWMDRWKLCYFKLNQLFSIWYSNSSLNFNGCYCDILISKNEYIFSYYISLWKNYRFVHIDIFRIT